MIFEEFNPKIHDYHKVAEFIYAVDFRTYSEIFKTEENAIKAIEDLLLVETEDMGNSNLDNTENLGDKSKSKLYVVLDDTDFENFDSDVINTDINNLNNNTNKNNTIYSVNNSLIETNEINNINDKYINSLDINIDSNEEITSENNKYNPKNIIGMLQIVKGKKDGLIGDILYLITKLKSLEALRFSYMYFLDSLVLANLNEDDLYIAEIAIDECKRGKGLGTKIIKKVIKKAKEKGFKRVVLDTDLRNIGAVKLYESIGFKKFNEKSPKFFKKERGMYNMEYIL